LGKRLVKTPKLYFVDVGLACHLLGIRKQSQLVGHPLRGALFENLIVAEALKQRLHSGRDNNLLFYRDQVGNEVDLVAEDNSQLHAIEIKSGQTIASDFFKNLNRFAKITGKVKSSTLVYGGEEKQIRSTHTVVPWRDFKLP
jgi:predicted AAA+ superfamily ATPase